eukprot:gb/GEZN01002986.1/.p1 GENE.gb/GEZN01002986.1/~~gb/GEZN01002986.1/.p1  ORF type:complete len:566 (-),score=82.53 gb/GEZN01002986.1/:551-2248(-)
MTTQKLSGQPSAIPTSNKFGQSNKGDQRLSTRLDPFASNWFENNFSNGGLSSIPSSADSFFDVSSPTMGSRSLREQEQEETQPSEVVRMRSRTLRTDNQDWVLPQESDNRAELDFAPDIGPSALMARLEGNHLHRGNARQAARTGAMPYQRPTMAAAVVPTTQKVRQWQMQQQQQQRTQLLQKQQKEQEAQQQAHFEQVQRLLQQQAKATQHEKLVGFNQNTGMVIQYNSDDNSKIPISSPQNNFIGNQATVATASPVGQSIVNATAKARIQMAALVAAGFVAEPLKQPNSTDLVQSSPSPKLEKPEVSDAVDGAKFQVAQAAAGDSTQHGLDVSLLNNPVLVQYLSNPVFTRILVNQLESASASTPQAAGASDASLRALCLQNWLSGSEKRRGRKPSRNSGAAAARPFVCPYPGCGDGFPTQFSLKRHFKRHSGQKPFSCTWQNQDTKERCSMRFAEKSTLKRHLQMHVGKKPYVCPFPECHRSFADRINLQRHEDKHSQFSSSFSLPPMHSEHSDLNFARPSTPSTPTTPTSTDTSKPHHLTKDICDMDSETSGMERSSSSQA